MSGLCKGIPGRAGLSVVLQNSVVLQKATRHYQALREQVAEVKCIDFIEDTIVKYQVAPKSGPKVV